MSLVGFRRPTLEQLQTQLSADLAANMPQIDTDLPGTPLWGLSRALAASLHQLYGLLDWAADQRNALYAEDEYLDEFGVIWDVVRKQATAASGTVTVTGTNGAVIPADAELRTADAGLTYLVTESATVASGTATVSIECAEFGARGNLSAGVQLAFVSPLAGVDSRATVVSVSGGADLEGNTAYRNRILARIHQAPHGGTPHDYVEWVLRVPGVTRAWADNVDEDPGVVVVRFMMDESRDNGIPTLEDVHSVQLYLDTRRPITAEVMVYAPVASPVNVTITGLAPDNAEVRAFISRELDEMIKREAEPGGTLYLSQFWDAISQAAGVEHFSLTTPSANVTSTDGQIRVLGTVTFA